MARAPGQAEQLRRKKGVGTTMKIVPWLFALVLSLGFVHAPLHAQTTGTVRGRVLDNQTGQPIANVAIKIRSTELGAVSTQDGRFEIPGVPLGPQIVLISHVSYGESISSVSVAADQVSTMQLRLTARPIAVDSVIVEGRSDLDQRRMSTGFSMNELVRSQIDAAAQRGQSMWELIRDQLPQVRVTQQNSGFISCLEFRGSQSLNGNCQMMGIYVDGVYMSAPGTIPPNMPLNDVERIEAISPGQAGMQYGSLGGNGVLLIETRSGPRPDRARPNGELLPGFDWSRESQPYPLAKVIASTFAGNALGLGIGLLAARNCVAVGDGFVQLEDGCGGLKAVGGGAMALMLPSLLGTYAARWAGATNLSEGRIVPGVLLGVIPGLAGYLFVIQSESAGGSSSGLKTTGGILLGIAAPSLIVLSDRVFRRLR
jgi:hypothetical protein